MTKLSRLITILFPLFAVLIPGAASWAQQHPPIFEKAVKTMGLDSWDKIEAIR